MQYSMRLRSRGLSGKLPIRILPLLSRVCEKVRRPPLSSSKTSKAALGKLGGISQGAQGRAAAMETLRLDGDIRNWVLIPITVAMFLVGVLRHNFAKLLRSDAKVP